MPKKQKLYYAQFREDRWVVKHLHLPARGVFVDVGASNGIKGNNTYYFENKGWHGLCIDADPQHSMKLKKQRKLVEVCAVSSQTGDRIFHQHPDGSLSGFAQTVHTKDGKIVKLCSGKKWKPIVVPTYTLEELLIKHNISTIDLLSIDVEGLELDVWSSFNVEKHRPKVVIVEFNKINRTEILDTITSYGYKIVGQTRANMIFTRNRK